MPDPNLPTETDKDPQDPQTPAQPESEPTVPTNPQTPPPADPAQPPIDYEKKFAESTRENQILQAKLDEESRKNARRELTTEPTDSELLAAFPDWDIMTDTEKRLARQSFSANRIASTLHEERQQEKAERQWNTDLELTIAQNPSLQGKELAFKEFAKKPTHRGAPLAVLVSAFLHESSSPATTPSFTPAPTGPTEVLPSGNGGPRGPETPKLLTGEELKKLRQSDEKAYKAYIRTHDLTDIAD